MTGQADSIVSIVTEVDDKFLCLERALATAGLFDALKACSEKTGKAPDELKVFLKPDLAFFFKPFSTITDPELVDHLAKLLADAGYTQISLGVARDSSGFWLENRDPIILADLAGYSFSPYDFVDLSEDATVKVFPPTSVLADTLLSAAWTDADFRIVFAKFQTHEELAFTGALHSLLGVLPHPDTEQQYYQRVRPEDAVAELLQRTPVDFAILDLFLTNQGSAGALRSNPVATNTIIASDSPLLADRTAAMKFGIDPYNSPILAKQLNERGLASSSLVVGSLTPFPTLKTVDPLMRELVRGRNASLPIQRSAAAWLQAVDRELFAFKDGFTDRVNAFLTAQLGAPDTDPISFGTLLSWNWLFTSMGQINHSSKILFAKEHLNWIERPLNIDIAPLAPADYEASKAYMEPLEAQVSQLTPDPNGLRMQYLDKSVLFKMSRTVPISFDDFVQRVDVSQSIRMMNDYIGGSYVPVLFDEKQRVTHQAERNIYLPQPNYIALSGGQPIDVTKLEFVLYSGAEHKIYWRTVKSENGSARFDDGSVSFLRTLEGETQITVIGRQEFVLPPAWQMVQLDLFPALKDYLVADAYRTFFDRTIANFTSAFEGRPYRVGKPWPSPADPQQAPVVSSEQMARSFAELASKARTHLDEMTSRFSLRTEVPKPDRVDENGFAHFTTPSAAKEASRPATIQLNMKKVSETATEFFRDLATAVNKDLERGSRR